MTEERFRYLPDTAEDEKEMLAVIGVESMEDLFTDIPDEIRLKEALAIPAAVSESELLKQMKDLAEKNVSAGQMPIFMGAGTYDHYIPSVVDAVISRSEFYTAYTPYQAEASQGELQAIFEFQSMISELTGMEATNSSLYDGFASLSEAVGLAAAVTKRKEIVLSQAVHPNARAVVHTAAKGRGLEVIEVLMEKDVTNFGVTRCLTTPDTAAIVVQYPNFFGSIEDLAVVKKIAEDKGALLIVMANPLALGILEAPGKLGGYRCRRYAAVRFADVIRRSALRLLLRESKAYPQSSRTDRRGNCGCRGRTRFCADAPKPRAAYPPRKSDFLHEFEPSLERVGFSGLHGGPRQTGRPGNGAAERRQSSLFCPSFAG